MLGVAGLFESLPDNGTVKFDEHHHYEKDLCDNVVIIIHCLTSVPCSGFVESRRPKGDPAFRSISYEKSHRDA